MCFNQPVSAAFCLLSAGTGAFLRRQGHPFRRYQMFFFFALMEAIQFFAYFVADECDNPVNKVLTMAAFLHVMYQGLSVNYFYLCPEYGISADVRKLVLWMCGISGTMGWLTKLPWPVWLGASPTLLDGLAARLPDLFSYSTAGSEEACRYETMCGPRVCTFLTPNHIGWSVPALPPSYFLPSGFVHFMLFFFPALIMGNAIARGTMVAAFFTGPILTMLLASRHMRTYKFEWPATWCYLSVVQVAFAVGLELYAMRQEVATGKGAGSRPRRTTRATSAAAANGTHAANGTPLRRGRSAGPVGKAE